MKSMLTAAATLLVMAAPAFAEGDAAKGEKAMKKCKACHMIVSPEGETILKGGKTGPNLYGVIGRAVGSEDFKYGKGLMAAGEAGVVWDEATLTAFITDPKTWLTDNGYEKKTKMSFKLKKGAEDVAAYLASVAPAPAAEEAAEGTTASE